MGKKILHIAYSKSLEDSEILKDRIKKLGSSYYNYLPCNWLIETDKTAQEAHTEITTDGFEESSILVLRINSDDYWGRMNTSLWEWFK